MSGCRKLLFYTHGLSGGGAERVIARLASGFAARGDNVILTVDFEAQENLGFLSKDVDLRLLPPGHARAVQGLARMLRQEQPAVSVSAISVSNLKHAAAAMIAGRSRRAILCYHGFYESEPQRLSNIGYRLTPVLSRLTGATVAVSNCLRDDLLSRFSASRARVRTIYNPAAPDPFPAEMSEEELGNRPPLVLTLGRLVTDKDYITLLRAFARVRHPDGRLVILGEGPERSRLEAESRALGIENRIAMPGFRSGVSAEFAQARCFALSSIRESFSLACVEAIAHGLPAIVTNCGGPAEIVNAPAIGTIVPVGDVDALAQAIDAKLAQPGAPKPRQDRASAFSLEAALDCYDALIHELIRSN
ncbi:MAG: glycosyltransferase [Rhodomicrobium sp.]